jgi:integrase/recombinase XerD
MPKRKAPKGCFWRGNTLWGRLQTAGGDVKWSLRTDDPQVAKVRRERERQRLIAKVYYGEDRRAFQDALDGWSKFIVNEVSPSTLKRYTSSLLVLQPHLDGLFLDEITKDVVGEIVKVRRDNPTIPRGKKKPIHVKNATIKRDLTALSSVMDFAVDQEWRDDNPVLAWLRPASRRKSRIRERRDPITLPDSVHVQMVIDRAPGLFAKLIDAARRTGARLNELAFATRTQVQHQRRQLTIIGKRNKRRTIDLEPRDYDEVFRSLPVSLRTNWLFWHDESDEPGQPYRTASGRFRFIVKSVANQAQKQEQAFRGFRFHDLRHLHAVEWLKSGRSIYDLQKRLGHTSIKTTEMYLEFLTPDEQRVVTLTGTKTGT